MPAAQASSMTTTTVVAKVPGSLALSTEGTCACLCVCLCARARKQSLTSRGSRPEENTTSEERPSRTSAERQEGLISGKGLATLDRPGKELALPEVGAGS